MSINESILEISGICPEIKHFPSTEVDRQVASSSGIIRWGAVSDTAHWHVYSSKHGVGGQVHM